MDQHGAEVAGQQADDVQAQARELVDRGYEVRMMNALEVRPLDPKLVMSDEQAEAWFTERTTGVRRQEES